jgi:hypothetical protein
MTTAAPSFPFPNATLTPITSQPMAATIRQPKKEVHANACSVHSEFGGSLNGHLDITMPTAAYITHSGMQFGEPNHPGI